MTRGRLNELARTIFDSNRYMALGTADPEGHPWVSPVWFGSETTTTSSGLVARREALTERCVDHREPVTPA